ncbi:hypothetical protein BJV82DRAFT_614536 [Fennellomyces sp. T-0311]|nr:hypothetical protein BJV82DRAFT_614536 [Fennellomyces sp. T-0311]
MDSYGNIYPLTNPLLLGTSAFAVAGWLIAFIGACVAAMHGVTWWIIIFELFFTVGIVVAIGVAGFGPHRGMLLTLLAISIVYLTYGIPIVYYENSSGAKACLGGLIILIIMQYFWVFLLGCSEESKLYSLFYGGRHGGGLPRVNPPMIQRNFIHPQRKENPLPPIGSNHQTPANNSPIPQEHQQPQNFPTATALHSYQANPDDPNELSFSKDESLEILDKKGNWWQAKKQDGSVGIVPSNYFSS